MGNTSLSDDDDLLVNIKKNDETSHAEIIKQNLTSGEKRIEFIVAEMERLYKKADLAVAQYQEDEAREILEMWLLHSKMKIKLDKILDNLWMWKEKAGKDQVGSNGNFPKVSEVDNEIRELQKLLNSRSDEDGTEERPSGYCFKGVEDIMEEEGQIEDIINRMRENQMSSSYF